jgi:signal transduction histidine kinase
MRNNRDHPRRDRSLKERLWWFDVVYPITLAAILFASLTYIVYSGRPSTRLSLLAEREFIEFSLRRATHGTVVTRGKTVVVSADPLSLTQVGRAPLGSEPDAAAPAYARVITGLAEAGVRHIFVRWDVAAHPNDDVYYLPLVDALTRLPSGTQVYWAASVAGFDAIPKALTDKVVLLDEGTCDEPIRVNTFCSFNADWNDWVVQRVALLTGGNAVAAASTKAWLAALPSNTPSYLLNLAAPTAQRRLAFADFPASPATTNALKGVDYAFIGPDQSQAVSGDNQGPAVHRVLTVYDAPDVDVSAGGTPLHVFWAQIAQMFLDRAMPVVPSPVAIAAITVSFCVLVSAVMWVFGGPAALGMFLVFGFAGPVINALALRYLNIYMPLFDTLYFGLSTFIFVGFGRLSLTAFQRWRLEERRRMYAHTADLKGNFISLLSHNLNTPVAKMQGILALLGAQQATRTNQEAAMELAHAEALVAQLEYSIRSVLIASTLEEGSLAEAPRSIAGLLDDFSRTMGPSLKRLGVHLVMAPLAKDDDGEWSQVPVAVDARALTSALAALAALFSLPTGMPAVTVRVEPKVVGEDDGVRVLLTYTATDAWVPNGAAGILTASRASAVRSLAGSSFFTDVQAGLAQLTVRLYQGRMRLRPEGQGGRIEVEFSARLPG